MRMTPLSKFTGKLRAACAEAPILTDTLLDFFKEDAYRGFCLRVYVRLRFGGASKCGH